MVQKDIERKAQEAWDEEHRFLDQAAEAYERFQEQAKAKRDAAKSTGDVQKVYDKNVEKLALSNFTKNADSTLGGIRVAFDRNFIAIESKTRTLVEDVAQVDPDGWTKELTLKLQPVKEAKQALEDVHKEIIAKYQAIHDNDKNTGADFNKAVTEFKETMKSVTKIPVHVA